MLRMCGFDQQSTEPYVLGRSGIGHFQQSISNNAVFRYHFVSTPGVIPLASAAMPSMANWPCNKV
jgi:hypothetical protein